MSNHLLTFRVSGDPNDVRDLGNGLREAVQSAQKRGLHRNVAVDGPEIELVSDVPPPRDPRKPRSR